MVQKLILQPTLDDVLNYMDHGVFKEFLSIYVDSLDHGNTKGLEIVDNVLSSKNMQLFYSEISKDDVDKYKLYLFAQYILKKDKPNIKDNILFYIFSRAREEGEIKFEEIISYDWAKQVIESQFEKNYLTIFSFGHSALLLYKDLVDIDDAVKKFSKNAKKLNKEYPHFVYGLSELIIDKPEYHDKFWRVVEKKELYECIHPIALISFWDKVNYKEKYKVALSNRFEEVIRYLQSQEDQQKWKTLFDALGSLSYQIEDSIYEKYPVLGKMLVEYLNNKNQLNYAHLFIYPKLTLQLISENKNISDIIKNNSTEIVRNFVKNYNISEENLTYVSSMLKKSCGFNNCINELNILFNGFNKKGSSTKGKKS